MTQFLELCHRWQRPGWTSQLFGSTWFNHSRCDYFGGMAQQMGAPCPCLLLSISVFQILEKRKTTLEKNWSLLCWPRCVVMNNCMRISECLNWYGLLEGSLVLFWKQSRILELSPQTCIVLTKSYIQGAVVKTWFSSFQKLLLSFGPGVAGVRSAGSFRVSATFCKWMNSHFQGTGCMTCDGRLLLSEPGMSLWSLSPACCSQCPCHVTWSATAPSPEMEQLLGVKQTCFPHKCLVSGSSL